MKQKYFSQYEKMSLFEKLTYKHTYDEDLGLVIRTGYSLVPVMLGLILVLGVATLIAL